MVVSNTFKVPTCTDKDDGFFHREERLRERRCRWSLGPVLAGEDDEGFGAW
jgi:hypothetical protein